MELLVNAHDRYLIAKGRMTRHLAKHRRTGPDVKLVEPSEWREFLRLVKEEQAAHQQAFGL